MGLVPRTGLCARRGVPKGFNRLAALSAKTLRNRVLSSNAAAKRALEVTGSTAFGSQTAAQVPLDSRATHPPPRPRRGQPFDCVTQHWSTDAPGGAKASAPHPTLQTRATCREPTEVEGAPSRSIQYFLYLNNQLKILEYLLKFRLK